MSKQFGYGFFIGPGCGRIGRFWWVNSYLIPRQAIDSTPYISWGTFGWGKTLKFHIHVLAPLTTEIKGWFDEQMEKVNSTIDKPTNASKL